MTNDNLDFLEDDIKLSPDGEPAADPTGTFPSLGDWDIDQGPAADPWAGAAPNSGPAGESFELDPEPDPFALDGAVAAKVPVTEGAFDLDYEETPLTLATDEDDLDMPARADEKAAANEVVEVEASLVKPSDYAPGPLQSYVAATQALSQSTRTGEEIVFTTDTLIAFAQSILGEISHAHEVTDARVAAIERQLSTLEPNVSLSPNITVERVTCEAAEVMMPGGQPATTSAAAAAYQPEPAPAPNPAPTPTPEAPAAPKKGVVGAAGGKNLVTIALGIIIGLAVIAAIVAVISIVTGTPITGLFGGH